MSKYIRTKKFTPEERRDIIEKGYRKGLSLREIAAQLESSANSVKVMASRWGITAKYPKQHAGKTIGIRVPREKMLDWNYLTQHKRYSAKEAAEMLGLLP